MQALGTLSTLLISGFQLQEAWCPLQTPGALCKQLLAHAFPKSNVLLTCLKWPAFHMVKSMSAGLFCSTSAGFAEWAHWEVVCICTKALTSGATASALRPC